MASIIVIENFYSDPHYIRERALAMEWSDDHGNHPGMRTLISDRDDSVKIALENAIGSKIIHWDEEWNPHNGCYNLCKSWDKCWIHSDWGTTWACVVYLTPNTPVSSGTALYKHKETGTREKPLDNQELSDHLDSLSNDFTAWEMTDYVGNVFNRAVIYEGKFYHSAVQYFGNSDDYCRLHQTFFFSTE